MDQVKKVVKVLKPGKEKEDERLSNFYKNGSSLLVELIASFGGHYKLPIRSFSAGELIRATNKFSQRVYQTNLGNMFTGNLEERPILVQFYSSVGMDATWSDNAPSRIIRDIVITSQMRHLKNVLQLIGCCLEFKYPAIVYEYSPGTEFLTDRLRPPNDGNGTLLSWRSRIKIANDIANVLIYLHTAFSTPIIFRDLNTKKVIIDHSGAAKLFQFAYSISLPPGKFQVESQDVIWTYGYLDPEYSRSSRVTLKADVYSLGVLMLVLFTGETDAFKYDSGIEENIHILEYVKSHIEKDQITQLVDTRIFEDEGNNDLMQHWLNFLHLALKCTLNEGKDRPDMIDVAKELRQIEKSVRNC